MKRITANPEDYIARRIASEWCNIHGIDPNNVPIHARYDQLNEETAEIEVYERDKAGRLIVEGNDVRKRWLIVHPLQQPFPAELLEDA
jgi:hypothetical protein